MLISCPVCQQQISINAPTCPICGEPFQASSPAAGPTMLATAYAVFAGLLLFIGLLLLGTGGFGMATYSSPAEDAQTRIDATSASGQYVNPFESSAASQVGVIRSEEKLQSSKLLATVGGVCTLPFLVLVVTRGFRKSRNSIHVPVPIPTSHGSPPPMPPTPTVKITMTRKP